MRSLCRERKLSLLLDRPLRTLGFATVFEFIRYLMFNEFEGYDVSQRIYAVAIDLDTSLAGVAVALREFLPDNY